MKKTALLTIELKQESDVVLIRQRARTLAGLLKFDSQDQVRIATAVSEIARNAYQYAGGGFADFAIVKLQPASPQSLQVTIRDHGPGIAELKTIMDGQYVSKTGMGVGLLGAKRLMDAVEVKPNIPHGTAITLRKDRAPSLKDVQSAEIMGVIQKLTAASVDRPFEEVKIQNTELLSALTALSEKQENLERVNAELESTTRGVLALYTELDEKATELKRASATKSAFLANMTHEFRSPLNSMLNISAFLLDPESGVKDPDHLKQVQFIRKSALDLSVLVNDLLDLAKVEAGKIAVRVEEFTSNDLFGALKGLMKPLLVANSQVELIFEDGGVGTILQTDEGKLSQILRNLISNALKYTVSGEVRVGVAEIDSDTISFYVKDTGIGIAKFDQTRIFEEFVQVDSKHQSRIKGTGLGLPLARRLAELLGGKIEVESTVGVGSTFTLSLPIRYVGMTEGNYLAGLVTSFPTSSAKPSGETTVLIIDDQEQERLPVKRLLESWGHKTFESDSGAEGVRMAKKIRPAAILLDLSMQGMDGFEVIKSLMSDPDTRKSHVIVHSSRDLDIEEANYFAMIGTPFLHKEPVSSPTFQRKLAQYLRGFGINSPSLPMEASR